MNYNPFEQKSNSYSRFFFFMVPPYDPYSVFSPLHLQSNLNLCNLITFITEGLKLHLRGIEMRREDNRDRERQENSYPI